MNPKPIKRIIGLVLLALAFWMAAFVALRICTRTWPAPTTEQAMLGATMALAWVALLAGGTKLFIDP